MISVCTITFNRRPFIPSMIQCFQHQDYQGEIEWIIVDDGTDPIGDLVEHLPQVRYFRITEKMTIGKKRNLMNSYAKGDILVYMDDDDYYPPERISHAVDMLKHSDALCAGSSVIHVYFHHIQKIIEFGPYGPNHATAGTFAMKRELLQQTSYDETMCISEEKHFLKNYTIPFVQLDPKKTILVVSHDHNTFDKKKLLTSNKNMKETSLTMKDFIKEPVYRFFMHDVHNVLKTYDPGLPEHKPDVMKELSRSFFIKIGDKKIYEPEIVKILNDQAFHIVELKKKIVEQNKKIAILSQFLKTNVNI
jgi:glycosyltransferase involved in cell wall biosynthesis